MEVSIENLRKNFGAKVAVQVDQLNIPSGQCFGLVGNNGAGKTTLFRCLLDLIVPDSGHILIGGRKCNDNDQWKSFTGSYLDEGFLLGHLLPEEYFDFIAALHGLSLGDKEAVLHELQGFFNGEILGTGKLIRDFSKGNQKKIGIAAALLFKPSLVVLDEPFANLDPSSQIRLKQLILAARGNGTTWLISSHDLQHLTEVSERIVLLEHGIVVRDIKTAADTLHELETYFSGTL